MTIRFFDTCSLLLAQERAFEKEFVISDVTLHELEEIKNSTAKEQDVKYAARKIGHLLDEHDEMFRVITWSQAINDAEDLDINNDRKIVQCARYIANTLPDDNVEFYSEDISVRNIARKAYSLNVLSVNDLIRDGDDEYKGFLEIVMTDEEYLAFADRPMVNTYNLLCNEYLIIRSYSGELIDTVRWNGERYEQLFKKNIKTIYFDKLKAKDIYQSCVVDSIMNNPITAISGKAGSGKSLLSLMTAMYLVESGKYDTLVVLFNPVKVRGATDLGYYSGDFIDKAMQNSIGQILTTKFGDRYAIDLLLSQNKLKLVSIADARGMEIRDSEILYITEAENTSIDIMKVALSRVSSGSKVIVEGDYETQVDSKHFEGKNNGLKRVIDAFKGQPEFGYVQLQNIWRSRIAELCELL